MASLSILWHSILHCLSNEPDAIYSVTAYSAASGELTLHHNYPQPSEAKAVVDVRLLLQKITVEQTSVGEWVNIIGYISCPTSRPLVTHSRKRKTEPSTVHVQALMLWSTGPLDISRYEASLADVALSEGPTSKRDDSNAT